MDEQTSLMHENLWVHEDKPGKAADVDCFTDDEGQVYKELVENKWGSQIRLEQEQLSWEYAWRCIMDKSGAFKC